MTTVARPNRHMGRPVLVTGANSGIGLATALHVARLGFPVVGSARTPEQADATKFAAAAASAEIETVVMDLADEATYRDVIPALGLWGVVNNAGYMNVGTIEDVSIETVRRQFEAMVFAPMRIAALALPAMRQRGEGRIVNVTSAAIYAAGPLIGWYSAAKQALAASSRALRLETTCWGVDVVEVEPGAFRTAIWDKAEADLEREHRSNTPQPYRRARKTLRCLRPRMGDPTDVAHVIGRALRDGRPRRTYRVAWDAWGVAATSGLVPAGPKERLLRTIMRP